jgi:hypothetical protein
MAVISLVTLTAKAATRSKAEAALEVQQFTFKPDTVSVSLLVKDD